MAIVATNTISSANDVRKIENTHRDPLKGYGPGAFPFDRGRDLSDADRIGLSARIVGEEKSFFLSAATAFERKAVDRDVVSRVVKSLAPEDRS